MTSAQEAGAPRCRFCFEGDESEELISPCACSGSQGHVHLKCLHQWQAHRMLETASRERHNPGSDRCGTCEVCHAPLRVAPPSNDELLHIVRPDSGAALVAALRSSVLLVSTQTSISRSSSLPPSLNMLLLLRGGHWVKSIFLLYSRTAGEGSDGSDCICGVNLSREITVDDHCRVTAVSPSEVLMSDLLTEIVSRVSVPFKDAVAAARAAGATVRFFIGGPCSPNKFVTVHTMSGFESAGAAATEDGLVRYASGDPLPVLEAARQRAAQSQQQQQPPPTVLLCIGHAKWASTQLQNEMLRGDWGINARGATVGLLGACPLMHADYVSEASGTRYVRAPPADAPPTEDGA